MTTRVYHSSLFEEDIVISCDFKSGLPLLPGAES